MKWTQKCRCSTNCCTTWTTSHPILIRLPHTIRTGKDSEPLPSPGKVSAVRHTIDKATSQLLHDIFNHASMEKIFQTLGVTKGYKQVRLPDFHCDACPQAKARRRGISHKVHMAQEKPTDSESNEVPALESDSDTEGTSSTDSDSESDDEIALTPQGEGHGQPHKYPSSPTSPPIVMEGQNENGTLTGASTTSPRPMREGPEQTVSPTGVSVTAPVQPNHPIRDFRDAFM